MTVDTATLPANLHRRPTTWTDWRRRTPPSATLAAGQNRTDFDFGYVGIGPGFALDKSASKTDGGAG